MKFQLQTMTNPNTQPATQTKAAFDPISAPIQQALRVNAFDGRNPLPRWGSKMIVTQESATQKWRPFVRHAGDSDGYCGLERKP